MRLLSTAPTLLLFLASVSSGCDSTEPESPDTVAEAASDPDPDRGALGKADLFGTCENTCGGPSIGTCYCDSVCWAYGDCCADVTNTCPGVANDGREELKDIIVALAENNTERTDNAEEVRGYLDFLVAELRGFSEPLDESTVLKYSPGSWRQVWSDENNDTGGPPPVRSQVYQYISPELWGYNFGVRSITPEVQVTFALGITASVDGTGQLTRIDAAFSRPTALQAGESIREISESIEAGTNSEFAVQELGEFPNGPIGAEAVVELLYVDESLKVGVADNVFTGDSEMYVLIRDDAVQP